MKGVDSLFKRLFSLLLSLIMVLSIGVSAQASKQSKIVPYASLHLNEYTVVLTAKGNGEMSISMSVDGTRTQDKIGVMRVDIDEKVNGVWRIYDTLDSVDHPEFYEYDSRDYLGSVSFYGTPGLTYRVTLLVYAEKDGSSDTGTVTSYTVMCQ